jgi:ribosomal protein L11 methyltransferase
MSVNKNKNYWSLEVIGDSGADKAWRSDVIEWLNETPSYKGAQEFSIDESKVDELLGERAYSGGDIPDDVINEIDERTQSEALQGELFYFEGDQAPLQAQAIEKQIQEKFPNLKTSLKCCDYEDWDAQWRKYYSRLPISDELEVVPEWEKKENLDNEIYIYPGQGFGTGGHETTFLCLKLFMDIPKDKIFNGFALDFGCGSGILGVAAIKKTDMTVDFCDVDTDALDNTLQNLKLNFNDEQLIGHRLIARDRFEAWPKYHLVFANILAPILIAEKKQIIGQLVENGYLILSGLLREQVSEVLEAYEDFECLKKEIKGDWAALLMKVK